MSTIVTPNAVDLCAVCYKRRLLGALNSRLEGILFEKPAD